MNAQTIITGCDLYDAPSGRLLHGDLWQMGDCYIFNGVYNERGEGDWHFPEQPFRPSEDKCSIIIVKATNFFERRAVVVIEKESCRMTRAAGEYIQKAQNLSEEALQNVVTELGGKKITP